ncbi:hypothetical protein BCR44DRAFT_1436018 [Catenaria anguillulae PL171]|uniref:Uncharacterized protein n=1 Tax=Catenaria anguillulae PL171 TaxID=765915 RepID=A0A1Y2HJ26_9FUNG|nr:hypothetical protein BCR44DRAFT_1436018 [Catenaria anguillulae PL171]
MLFSIFFIAYGAWRTWRSAAQDCMFHAFFSSCLLSAAVIAFAAPVSVMSVDPNQLPGRSHSTASTCIAELGWGWEWPWTCARALSASIHLLSQHQAPPLLCTAILRHEPNRRLRQPPLSQALPAPL